MERAKCIFRRLFCLPPALTVLIALPSFGAVIYVLAAGIEGTALTYAAYGASAYGLVVTATAVPRIVRSVREAVSSSSLAGRALNSPYGERLRKDVLFRAELSLYGGLAVNLLYAVIKLASAVYYRSFWFGSLAVYYILLAVMRFAVLHHVNKNIIGENIREELRRYRLCGILLLLMSQALAGVVILVVRKNSGFVYPGVFIYVMALYAFYTVITAVINVVKFRKYGSPVMPAAKAVNLTSALVSMLALETAMLAQFGTGDDPAFRRIMTGTTGGAVCVLVFAMALFMIVRAERQMKRLQGMKDMGKG